jgi:hypothetical protein
MSQNFLSLPIFIGTKLHSCLQYPCPPFSHIHQVLQPPESNCQAEKLHSLQLCSIPHTFLVILSSLGGQANPWWFYFNMFSSFRENILIFWSSSDWRNQFVEAELLRLHLLITLISWDHLGIFSPLGSVTFLNEEMEGFTFPFQASSGDSPHPDSQPPTPVNKVNLSCESKTFSSILLLF